MEQVTRPRKFLFAALAGIGAFYGAAQVSLWLSGRADASDNVVDAVARAPRAAAPPRDTAGPGAVPEEAPSGLGDRTHRIPAKAGDPFANLNWAPVAKAPPPAPLPAPAPPPTPAPPAAPQAPPMPFAFVGMLEKGAGRPQAFLAKGEALLVVGAGDLLDNRTYRVEALSPQEVVMTYLPLNIRQTLNVSGAAK